MTVEPNLVAPQDAALATLLAAQADLVGEGQSVQEAVDASRTDLREEARLDWGVNRDGWTVRVRNMTELPITPWYMGSDTVFSAPRQISPGEEAVVLGMPDPLRSGYPSDMSIDLRIGGWPNVLVVRRDLEGDRFTATVHHCGPWHGAVTSHGPTAPLEVRITRAQHSSGRIWAPAQDLAGAG